MMHCCHIDEQAGVGCPQPARFRLWGNSGRPDDYTEMCGDHAAEHKCDGDVVEPIPKVPSPVE